MKQFLIIILAATALAYPLAENNAAVDDTSLRVVRAANPNPDPRHHHHHHHHLQHGGYGGQGYGGYGYDGYNQGFPGGYGGYNGEYGDYGYYPQNHGNSQSSANANSASINTPFGGASFATASANSNSGLRGPGFF